MALTTSQQKLKIGSKAPDFKLKGADGKTYSLKDFSGSPLLVIFMCNHCPYVQQKIDAIIKLAEKFGGRVNVVGINSNAGYPGDDFEDMKNFASEKGINFPYVFDETQAAARNYGAVCTPDPFLFDKNMTLVFHGRIDDALELDATVREHTMDAAITKLLDGIKLDKTFEPSAGCSIKWK